MSQQKLMVALRLARDKKFWKRLLSWERVYTPLMTEDEFRELLAGQGCDDIRDSTFEPGHHTELHSHQFDAQLLVLEGEFILELEDGKHIFKVGETCKVLSGTMHAEHNGEAPTRTLTGLSYH